MKRERVPDPFPRNETPGLYVTAEPLDVAQARQLVSIQVASTATHSRSQGWLPCVLLTVDTVPLVGDVGKAPSERRAIMLFEDDVAELLRFVRDAFAAAQRDAKAGPVES